MAEITRITPGQVLYAPVTKDKHGSTAKRTVIRLAKVKEVFPDEDYVIASVDEGPNIRYFKNDVAKWRVTPPAGHPKAASSPEDRDIFQDGSRLAAPDELFSTHFFYHVDKVVSDFSDVFAKAAKTELTGMVFYPAQIKTTSHCIYDSPVLEEAVKKIAADLGLEKAEVNSATLLMCEWASLHADHNWLGKDFLSVVMHTGRHPYVMQTLHTEVKDFTKNLTSIDVPTTTRLLCVGDVFIFDPTTPHTAAPRRPADGQLLVMLQFELKDSDVADRASILERFKPKTDTVRGVNVFKDDLMYQDLS
jgi:hypothetical protein